MYCVREYIRHNSESNYSAYCYFIDPNIYLELVFFFWVYFIEQLLVRSSVTDISSPLILHNAQSFKINLKDLTNLRFLNFAINKSKKFYI